MQRNAGGRENSSSKTKNGCKTCKARRVKCDETRPACIRCIKGGRVCGGYPAPKYLPRKKSLLPKTPNSDVAIISVKPGLSDNIFPNEQEHRYFRLFYEETGRQLSAGFDGSEWMRIVIQTSHNEPSIRYLIVAIAALGKSQRTPHNAPNDLNGTDHHKYALIQYGKALNNTRAVVAKGSEGGLRTALLASLLIWSFENFNGAHDMAVKNIQSGISLMQSWVKRSNCRPQSGGTWSPRPDVIEDEIVKTFTRLNIHLASCGVNASSVGHIRGSKPVLPITFTSLSESRNYWERIASRIFEFTSSSSAVTVPLDTEETAAHSVMVVERLQRQAGFLEEIQNWKEAFEPVLQYSRTAEGKKMFLAAQTLRIQSLTIDICLAGAFFVHASYYEDFLPSFKEILDLAESIVNHSDFVRSFVFEVGLIMALSLVINKCTRREYRLWSIELLQKMGPRREGVWEAAKVADRGLRMDEKSSMRESNPNWKKSMDAGQENPLIAREVRLPTMKNPALSTLKPS